MQQLVLELVDQATDKILKTAQNHQQKYYNLRHRMSDIRSKSLGVEQLPNFRRIECGEAESK